MAEMLTRENPRITPYPDATTRWDYGEAARVTDALSVVDNAEDAARLLTEHIFRTHPDVLDLPPAVLHRFLESERIMASYPNGKELLQDRILEHFQATEDRFANNYTYAATATVVSGDPLRPAPTFDAGQLVQKVVLPESVARRGLVWNRRAQEQITNGNIHDLFGKHPAWVGVKLGEGSWLQAGNLMIEVADGLGRVRTPVHQSHDVERRWGLDTGNGWGAGLDQWFVMTHIMDKELLGLANRLDSSMIDGMQLLPGIYARSYLPILELMDLNPSLDIKGVLSDGTWAYSTELEEVFPEQSISRLSGIAGIVIELGSAEDLGMQAQIAFATHNPVRRAAFLNRIYRVGIAARFIDGFGMEAVIANLGLSR